MHTIEMFEGEREGFIGNVSDVVGDVTFILPGGFRHLLDDSFVASPCKRGIVNNKIVSLSGSIRDGNLE